MFIIELMKSAAQWSWSHKRSAAELALMLALAFACWRYSHDMKIANSAADSAHGLAADTALQLKISQNEVEVMKRNSSGTVTYKTVYAPPEGYVLVTQKEKSALQQQLSDLTAQLTAAIAKGDTAAAKKINDEISQVDNGVAITVVSHGWTFKPGYGLDWANQGIKPRLDFKFYFYNRFSLLAGGGPNGMGPGISRHIDDVVWGNPKNVEFFVQYNVVQFYQGDARWTVGLRSNF